MYSIYTHTHMYLVYNIYILYMYICIHTHTHTHTHTYLHIHPAVLVTQLDAKTVERAIVCAPGTIPTFSAAIISVEKVRFYKASCPSKRKFHVTTGHTTVMATAHFFILPPPPGTPAGSPLIQGPGAGKETAFDFGKEYLLV